MSLIKFMSWLRGEVVGQDHWGNTYYQSRPYQGFLSLLRGILPSQPKRRWVVYKGIAEASKVPPHWHGWLHYTTDAIPKGDGKLYPWQKDPQPNLTGTKFAYKPSATVESVPNKEHAPITSSGKSGDKSYQDYEAWKPE